MRLLTIAAALAATTPFGASADAASIMGHFKPADVVFEAFQADGGYMFDSKSVSSGAGYRIGGLWTIPMIPDAIKLRVNYLKLPSTTYEYEKFDPNNKHSQARWEDLFDSIDGKAIRDGDRTKAGFPATPFSMLWSPKGIEIGFEGKLAITRSTDLSARGAYIYDLSDTPDLKGFQIVGAKVRRQPGLSFGLGLHRKLSSNFEGAIFYDHVVLSSYVTGQPQAWNESGGTYLYGKRVYQTVGAGLGYSF